MDKNKPELDLKNIFSLLASDDLQDKGKASELKSSFFEAFARTREDGNANLRQKMIRFAGELEVENGLQPVLLGLRDSVRTVREEAKKSLDRLAQQLMSPNKGGKDRPPSLVKKSAEFSFAVYGEIKVTRDLNLIKFFLQTLLKIGESGAFLAWKFFVQNVVPQNIIVEMIKKLPEPLRLNFVYQYTLDKIAVRRRYDTLAKLLLKDIKDRRTIVEFLADLFDREPLLDPVFYDLCQRLNIKKTIAQVELRSNRQRDKIKGVKLLGLLGKVSDYHLCIPLLSRDEIPSVRIACLKMLSRSISEKDPKIIGAVSALLDDKDENIRLHAFNTLVALKAPALGEVITDLCKKHPAMRPCLYKSLCDLEWMELNPVLNALPSDQGREARRAVINAIIRNDPEKLIIFLSPYLKSSHDEARNKAAKLLKKIDSIKNKKIEEAVKDDTPEYSPSAKTDKKGLFEKRKQRKLLQRLLNGESLEGVEFQKEVLADLDLSGISLHNVNFDGAFFSNVIISSAKLYSVTFKGARFENVKMENSFLDSVSFEDAVIKGSSFTKASCSSCDFTNAWIYESSFGLANLKGSIFVNGKIKKTDFSQTDIAEASFVESDLTRVSFNFATLHLANFSLARGMDCDFLGADFSDVTTEQSELNTRSGLFGDVVLPDLFFEDAILKHSAFNLVVLAEEMDKRRKAFLEYNHKRTELALDTFQPEQGDLFALIPLLIHSNLELLPTDSPIRNAPAGIFGYSFPSEAFQLAKKYFIVDDFAPSLQKEHYIEGLFTIGSVGTIAQSADSDIDYWVCVDAAKLGGKGIKRLSAKLRAIETWAAKTFNTEIHCFVVDLDSVREDRFGVSDQESSGSAQGKILKEEFYRTMIHVAGKIPLWCVLPRGVKDKHYHLLLSLASQFHKDYLDLGNVSTIPQGEYFGASIWQLFKGMKSPYKSVMKMALLEKYIQEEERHGLLCNRLKAGWSRGRYDLRHIDPYLLLFEEVLDYYHRTEQKSTERLLQICFFMKLGIRSITDLDNSVIGAKKRLVQDYSKSWGWNETMVQDLGHFRDWPFDKIFQLSTRVNDYMIETYKKLSRTLQERSAQETIITPKDLTILGRKMFVQFSKKSNKVDKLPLIVHGKALFQQLYFQYKNPKAGPASWSLYHLKRDGQRERKGGDLLKSGRIEEICIWLVHNGLYLPTTSFQLMPNPTPISLQDILDLLRKLHEFYPVHEAEEIVPQALLKEPYIQKLFLTVNFNLNRKLKKVHEYTTIYMTSWGEFFCRTFHDKNGLNSVEEALSGAKEQFDLPCSSGQVGLYIPQLAGKHIQVR
ncbi:MAG: class I adenylate cyclase [Pseudomonadota bacterium]